MEEHLEIFIFTYNRAASLKRTLQQFSHESTHKCRITVLDNHSTDATPAVCEEASRVLPNFRHVRHPKNIGGLANYLRGIELAEKPYTWVICDDDSFDLSKAGDVFAEVRRGEIDIISVGVRGHELTPGKRGALLQFALEEPFFFGHSFVPSMIFRTALFDSETIRAGYDNIDTMFPHFPFLIKVAEENRRVMVSQEKVITKSNNVGYSAFRFMAGWIKSCRRFRNGKLKRKVIGEVFGGEAFFKTVIFAILVERQHRADRYREEFRALLQATGSVDRLLWLKLILFIPLVVAPKFMHGMLWDRYSRYRAARGSVTPNFDEER